MVYLLSLLGMLIEISLPFKNSILIISLSFLLYLIALKREKDVVWIGVISLILSLQTDDFFRVITMLLISYFIINLAFSHIFYEKKNILIFTVVQGLVYYILSKSNLDIFYFFINIVGFLIMNFIYISIFRKKDKYKDRL